MSARLDGMFWTHHPRLELPSAGGPAQASRRFLSELAPFAWNWLSTLEQNPATPQQAAAILAGQSVEGLSFDDQLQVQHFGDGARRLASLIREGAFRLDQKTACTIHALVGKEEALEWGVLRSAGVSIQGSDYLPPAPDQLPALMKDGFRFLDEAIANPVAPAAATLLFMSRSQFFFDANKRTVALMMSGILLADGLPPLAIPKKDASRFHQQLGRFYEAGRTDDMMACFADWAEAACGGRSERCSAGCAPNAAAASLLQMHLANENHHLLTQIDFPSRSGRARSGRPLRPFLKSRLLPMGSATAAAGLRRSDPGAGPFRKLNPREQDLRLSAARSRTPQTQPGTTNMNQNVKYGLFFLGGLAVGAIGAVVVTRGKLSVKPLASSLLSEGIDLKEKALAAVDGVKEEIADVVAEAKVKSQEKREAKEAAEAAEAAAAAQAQEAAAVEAPASTEPKPAPAC